jgi:hypothetical protein
MTARDAARGSSQSRVIAVCSALTDRCRADPCKTTKRAARTNFGHVDPHQEMVLAQGLKVARRRHRLSSSNGGSTTTRSDRTLALNYGLRRHRHSLPWLTIYRRSCRRSNLSSVDTIRRQASVVRRHPTSIGPNDAAKPKKAIHQAKAAMCSSASLHAGSNEAQIRESAAITTAA